mmetsp:Transcript_18220/g.57328  ORF Transcript_18220/g.57328 Transcript_18220/m.57328 type:complete len:1064 (+) Transcript_18220:915-4106(+)
MASVRDALAPMLRHGDTSEEQRAQGGGLCGLEVPAQVRQLRLLARHGRLEAAALRLHLLEGLAALLRVASQRALEGGDGGFVLRLRGAQALRRALALLLVPLGLRVLLAREHVQLVPELVTLVLELGLLLGERVLLRLPLGYQGAELRSTLALRLSQRPHCPLLQARELLRQGAARSLGCHEVAVDDPQPPVQAVSAPLRGSCLRVELCEVAGRLLVVSQGSPQLALARLRRIRQLSQQRLLLLDRALEDLLRVLAPRLLHAQRRCQLVGAALCLAALRLLDLQPVQQRVVRGAHGLELGAQRGGGLGGGRRVLGVLLAQGGQVLGKGAQRVVHAAHGLEPERALRRQVPLQRLSLCARCVLRRGLEVLQRLLLGGQPLRLGVAARIGRVEGVHEARVALREGGALLLHFVELPAVLLGELPQARVRLRLGARGHLRGLAHRGVVERRQLGQGRGLVRRVGLSGAQLRLQRGERGGALLAHGLEVCELCLCGCQAHLKRSFGLRLAREGVRRLRLLRLRLLEARLHGGGRLRRPGQLALGLAQLRGELLLALLQLLQAGAHLVRRTFHALAFLALLGELQLTRLQARLEGLALAQLLGQLGALARERVRRRAQGRLAVAHEAHEALLLRLCVEALLLCELCRFGLSFRLRLAQRGRVRLALRCEVGEARLRLLEVVLELVDAPRAPLRAHAQRLLEVCCDALCVHQDLARVHPRVHRHLHRALAELEGTGGLRVVGRGGGHAHHERGATVAPEGVLEELRELGVPVGHELSLVPEGLHHRAQPKQGRVDVHRLLEAHARQVAVRARALHALRTREVHEGELACHLRRLHFGVLAPSRASGAGCVRAAFTAPVEDARATIHHELEDGVGAAGRLVHAGFRVYEILTALVEELHERRRRGDAHLRGAVHIHAALLVRLDLEVVVPHGLEQVVHLLVVDLEEGHAHHVHTAHVLADGEEERGGEARHESRVSHGLAGIEQSVRLARARLPVRKNGGVEALEGRVAHGPRHGLKDGLLADGRLEHTAEAKGMAVLAVGRLTCVVLARRVHFHVRIGRVRGEVGRGLL